MYVGEVMYVKVSYLWLRWRLHKIFMFCSVALMSGSRTPGSPPRKQFDISAVCDTPLGSQEAIVERAKQVSNEAHALEKILVCWIISLMCQLYVNVLFDILARFCELG